MRKLIAPSLTALAFLGVAAPARAEGFSLHLEPGVAVPFTPPQRDIYNPGPTLNAEGLFKLHPNFAIGPALQATYLSRTIDNGNAGVLWEMGIVARLQGARGVPFEGGTLIAPSPWIEGNLSYARTGDLNRPSFGLRVGLDMFTDEAAVASWGPWIGYSHAFQTSTTDGGAKLLDSRDYNAAFVGLSFSFDFPVKRIEHVATQVVEHTQVVVQRVPTPCPACQAPAKQEWSERVYFNWDSTVLRWEESDKLDSLVARLNSHPNAAVTVQGHASADGQHAHNVDLAARRTVAVVDYLVAHGVDRGRLKLESYGPDKPFAPNDKQEGRERNRRVEFVISFTMTESK